MCVCVDVCACAYNMAMQLVGKKQTPIQSKVSGLSAGLVWARSLVCQLVWCGQGLWSVSRSGVGKVSGETMTSLHTHNQVVTTTEVEYLIPSMIMAYGHVSPMPAGHSMVTKSSIGAEGL